MDFGAIVPGIHRMALF